MMSMALPAMVTLAWRPFLEPLPLADHWMWLIIPLSLIISLVYRTLKMKDLTGLVGQTVRLTVMILVFMVAAAIVLYGVVRVV